jgi:hypothetical protein
MRHVLPALLACLALGLAAAPASAQQSSSNVFSSGMRSTPFSSGATQAVVNQPINTSNVIAPYPVQAGSSYLSTFIQSLHLPLLGGSTPPPGPFPSLSYPSGRSLPFTAANSLSPTGFLPITPKNNQ